MTTTSELIEEIFLTHYKLHLLTKYRKCIPTIIIKRSSGVIFIIGSTYRICFVVNNKNIKSRGRFLLKMLKEEKISRKDIGRFILDNDFYVRRMLCDSEDSSESSYEGYDKIYFKHISTFEEAIELIAYTYHFRCLKIGNFSGIYKLK